MLEAVLARFEEHAPVSVMARVAPERAIEPGLVQGSAQRLAPVVQAMANAPSLPGWRLRMLDGNHLPASEKRLAAFASIVARPCLTTPWWSTTRTARW